MRNDVLWTAGCDPEYFIRNIETQEYISAIPFCEGTKEKPLSLPSGGFVMRDNVAIEFGIQPADTEQEFVDRITAAIKDMNTIVPDGFELVAVPSAHFPDHQILHPEAKEFGCSVDFNAWTVTQNIPPEGCETDTFRSCGGHLHTGFNWAVENPELFIRWQDYFHGMVSTKLDNGPEAIARRTLYGKAGCYRPTDYGVEYRTLSNFWCGSESLIRLQYSLTNDICVGITEGKMVLPDLEPDVVQRTINEGDVKFATAIVKDFLYDQYFSDNTRHLLQEVGYEN